MLRSPKVSQGFLKALEAETTCPTLHEKVRQVIILTVGAIWQATYELYTAGARSAGLDDQTIAALAADQTPGIGVAEVVLRHRARVGGRRSQGRAELCGIEPLVGIGLQHQRRAPAQDRAVGGSGCAMAGRRARSSQPPSSE